METAVPKAGLALWKERWGTRDTGRAASRDERPQSPMPGESSRREGSQTVEFIGRAAQEKQFGETLQQKPLFFSQNSFFSIVSSLDKSSL